MGKKIAMCSYCSTRSVLVFDEGVHELTCSACGAPLKKMKFMPQQAEKEYKKPRKVKSQPDRKYRRSQSDRYDCSSHERWQKSKHKRRGKRFARKVFEEIWDILEDVFD
ncbi:MAG: hypothetical protein AAFQ28_10170 [Pseudomonadota bacterium]